MEVCLFEDRERVKGKGKKRGKYNLEGVKKGCRAGETVKNENLNNGERRRKRGKGK